MKIRLFVFSFIIVLVVIFTTTFLKKDSTQEDRIWSTVAELQIPRAGHFACNIGNKIYSVGGIQHNAREYVEEYDFSTDSCRILTELPTPRGDFSGCALNGKIYAIGGWNNETFSTVEVYDPHSDSEFYEFERLLPVLPQPWYFSSLSSISVDNKGNLYTATPTSSSIFVFNSDGNFITRWGSKGRQDGQFNLPVSLA